MDRFHRVRVLSTVTLLFAGLCAAAADAPAQPFTWEVSRTTSPESVDELRALQARVKQVQKVATPATVGLLLGNEVNPFAGMSCGSGVIVSADGLVLTAAHVIGRPREKVTFVLPNGKQVSGVTLGLNSTNDSGMARITDKPPKDYPGAVDGKWPYQEIAPSADLKKGQWIVSLGHPGGPKPDRPPPVRVGRFVELDKAKGFRRNDLLVTDATLVGGDSGGPLFDLTGKVVGIHSQIGETLTENLHVPTEKFRTEWDRMIRGDIIYRNDRDRDRNIKVGLGVAFDKTVLDAAKVEVVDAGGAADQAGLEAGDVIVKFNGHKVTSADDLRMMLPSYKVGETVKAEVTRAGAPLTLDVKLAEKSKQ